MKLFDRVENVKVDEDGRLRTRSRIGRVHVGLHFGGADAVVFTVWREERLLRREQRSKWPKGPPAMGPALGSAEPEAGR
jgi:hypothetical protein